MKAAIRIFYRRALPLCAALFLLTSPMAAQLSNNVRVKTLGKRLMCMCGCNQLLGECNHVGCTVSTEMLKKLEERVGRNESDDLILQGFVQEYGAKVLAQPPASGFTLLAWLMPFVVLIGGFFIVRGVLLRWRHEPVPAGVAPAASPEMIARVAAEADRDDWEGGN